MYINEVPNNTVIQYTDLDGHIHEGVMVFNYADCFKFQPDHGILPRFIMHDDVSEVQLI